MANTHTPCHHYWRKMILKRDGGRCRCCGSSDDIELAHVKDKEFFDDERESYCPENLLCLCKDCHSSYHFYERGLDCDEERAKKVKALFNQLND